MKRADIAEEQINKEGVTVHLYGNDVVYRDRGMQKRQAVLAALYERLAESEWPMGMHCHQSTLITH